MITVLGNRVLVKIEKAEEKSENGLIIPDTAREQEQEGIVYAVGEGEWIDGKLIPPSVQQGNRVFFGRQQGVEIKWQGETFHIFHMTQIQAIVEG